MVYEDEATDADATINPPKIVFLYSAEQWSAITWSLRTSSLFSIVGSATIIFMILRRRKTRLALLHNRLIFCMSLIDILSSISFGTGPAAAPSEMRTAVFHSYGNDATCTAQGFFITLGFCVPSYNACLCLYYLAVIKYNVREEILNRYEKYMHIFAILPPFIGAFLGTIFDLYQSSGGPVCWVVPNRLLESFPEYNTTASTSYNILLFALTGIILATITISMAIVYCAVRKQAETMQQYHSFQNRNGSSDEDGGAKKETAIQAFLYFGAYVCTYIWPIIANLEKRKLSFLLTLAIVVFYPLQGAFNSLAFIRPKYVAIRKKNRRRPKLWVLRAAIFSSLEEEEQKKRTTRVRSSDRINRLSTTFWDGIRLSRPSLSPGVFVDEEGREKTYSMNQHHADHDRQESELSLSQHSMSTPPGLKQKELANSTEGIDSNNNSHNDDGIKMGSLPETTHHELSKSFSSVVPSSPPLVSPPCEYSVLSLSSLVAQDSPISKQQRRSSLFLSHTSVEELHATRRQSLPAIRIGQEYDKALEDTNRFRDDDFL